MYQDKKIIITICARGGSKGVPKKNIRPLLGKPLIAHTIQQAKALGWADRIIVSTDDPEIQTVAKKYGADAPFLRPKNLAKDTSPKIPAIIHAVKTAEKLWKEKYNIVLDLDPTSPLRRQSDIEKIIETLINQPKTDVVFSVSEAYKNPYFNMVELNTAGYARLSKKAMKPIFRRQDAPKVYAMNASIYAMWTEKLLKQKSFFTHRSRIHIMPEECSIDIDRPIDFKFVELLMKEKLH